VYSDQPTAFFTQYEADLGGMDLSTSLGLFVGRKGAVKSVAWEGPAFRAGISPGAKLVAVGGQPYTDELLKQAIRDAAALKRPIELSFEADGASHTVSIPYFDSLRYPQLERISGAKDRLQLLLTPSRGSMAKCDYATVREVGVSVGKASQVDLAPASKASKCKPHD